MSPKQDAYYRILRCFYGSYKSSDAYYFKTVNMQIMADNYVDRINGMPHWWPMVVGW